jgi:putative addiction module component (TIGR02574 family)
MAATLDELTREILSLPADDRFKLAERIWDSIEDAHLRVEPMSDSVRAAAEDALRRDAEMSSGADEGRSLDEVMARIRQIT